MKKVYFLFISLIAFILVSCSQLAGGGTSGYYYVQQNNQSGKDDSIGGPTVDWGDEEDDGGTELTPPLVGEDGKLTISMFSVLQADGAMHSAGTTLLSGKLGGSDASYTGYAYETDIYENWKLLAKFSGANVPEMWYSGTQAWNSSASGWENYAGANSSAGSNGITNMNYMRAVGFNPFFSQDSSYNQAKYYVFNGDVNTGTTANIMERFHFYRFTGKGGGVADLDNFLVAVDTYSKLVYSFAKPTKWGSLLGNAVPLEWGPVDLVSTGPGGKKYKFYEYDPAGYVTEDGKFVMTADYNNNLASGNYDPVFTGKSPYLGNIIISSDGSIESEGGGEEKGYAVNGTLSVKAKYIKNVSVTDAWGDHGNADGEDKPEFIYSVRSRAYSGFEPSQWDVLSSFSPDSTGIMPNAAKTIKIGTTLQLGGVKNYNFQNIESGLTVELDNKIIEVDISGNDNITNYETPLIFLGYDRYSQVWYPKSDNGTYLRAPAEYPADFMLGQGETKDFVIKLAASHNETLELCYELSWNADTATEAGKIFSAQTRVLGDDYVLSGDNGVFDVLYIDSTLDSAEKPRTLSFEIELANLEPNNSIRVDYERNESSSGFIDDVRLDNGFAFGVISHDNPRLRVDVDLLSNRAVTQKGSVSLSFSDDSNKSVYDLGASPSEITFNITREDYTEVSPATLIISNAKLKNNSVMDVGGDGWGGYDQPEFIYDIKTKHNDGEWKNLSNTNSSVLIQTGKDAVSLSGTNTHIIENPREGIQKIYISSNIYEVDSLAGNANDIVMQHDKPLIELEYEHFSDTWKVGGSKTYYFTDGNDMQWQIKKIDMGELKRGGKATMTISLSAFVHDIIWPTDEGFLAWITSVINGPTTAGWGDMELTFDLEWSEN